MPHATNGEMTPQNLTNGDSQQKSKFINHLQSYPVVSDSIETFKSNPYGKKSLEMADNAYKQFAKPVEPYLETPYSYAKPYVTKADELADSALGHVDTRFPAVKEDTRTVVDKGKGLVWFPFKVAGEGKEYVMTSWSDEYNKTASHKSRGDGFMTLIMALISVQLKFASDFFQAVTDFLGPKYEESKKKGSDYVRQAQDSAAHLQAEGQEVLQNGSEKADQIAKEGQNKAGEYQKAGQEKAGEYQKVGQEKTEQLKQDAQKTKDEAQKKTQK